MNYFKNIEMNQLQHIESSMHVLYNKKRQAFMVDNIIMIKAISNYSTIYFGDGRSIMTSKTLKYWQNLINSDKMIRIHNANLVHTAAIKYFRNHDKTVVLKNGMGVKFSRRRHRSLKSAENYCHLCKSI